MDPDIPAGMGGFFPGMFGDILRLLKTDAPLQWELAVQLAQTIAADGEAEPNVDPVERIRLEQLAGIADLYVADVTGMTITPNGRPVGIVPTGPATWARSSLEGWRMIFERIAAALQPVPGEESESVEASADQPLGSETEDMAAFIGRWAKAVAPSMLAMQIGSIVGNLAKRTLGQYELPIPRSLSGELFVVPRNVSSFATDWGLSVDDVVLVSLVRDIATHAVLSRPHVRERMEELLVAHAQGFRPNPEALEGHLGEVTPGKLDDLAELTQLLSDPGALGEIADTPELARIRTELNALTAVIEGYAEWVTDTVAERTSGGRGPVHEALRRRRVERSEGDKVAEALFGLRLDQAQVDRGDSFIRGVLDRGGAGDLAKIWVVEANLPTPAEVDAPGLWLERVNLPTLDERR